MLNIEDIKNLRTYTNSIMDKYNIDELLLEDWAQDLLLMPDYLIIKKIPSDKNELLEAKDKFYDSFMKIAQAYNIGTLDVEEIKTRVSNTLNKAIDGIDRTVPSDKNDGFFKTMLSHLL